MENVMIGTQKRQVEHHAPKFGRGLNRGEYAEIIQSNYADGGTVFNYVINDSWANAPYHRFTVALFRIKLKPHI